MIAVIADVHGNWPALREVLADADILGCRQVVCLGDVAGYYCMVDVCADELQRRNAAAILGNHDHYLVNGTSCPRSTSANVCLEYQRQHVTAVTVRWLRGLPLRWTTDECEGVHGGWRDCLDEYMYDIKGTYFAGRGRSFYFSGHTHCQRLDRLATCIYCNPGSVGQPRDGDPRAAYAVFDGGQVLLRRVAYDIDETAASMRVAGFSEYYTTGLYRGSGLGKRPDATDANVKSPNPVSPQENCR